jgi:hypothetical protein
MVGEKVDVMAVPLVALMALTRAASSAFEMAVWRGSCLVAQTVGPKAGY